MPHQSRAGQHASSASTVAAGSLRGNVALSIVPPDLDDPANSIAAKIQRSEDGGTTWKDWIHFTWIGHSDNISPPEVDFNVAHVVGQQTRILLDIPVQIPVGADMEFTS